MNCHTPFHMQIYFRPYFYHLVRSQSHWIENVFLVLFLPTTFFYLFPESLSPFPRFFLFSYFFNFISDPTSTLWFQGPPNFFLPTIFYFFARVWYISICPFRAFSSFFFLIFYISDPTSTIWFDRYRSDLFRSVGASEHETFLNPVAILLATHSSDPAPFATYQRLWNGLKQV